MKISIPFLTLLSASSVLSFDIYKRGAASSNIQLIASLSESCKQDFNNPDFLECYDQQVTMENYKEVCATFNTEKCQKIFDDPFTVLPNCKDQEILTEVHLSKLFVEYNKRMGNYICTYDENGEICPTSKQSVSRQLVNEYTIAEACKSKRCSESALDFYGFIADNIEEFSEMGGIVGDPRVFSYTKEKLLAKECTSQHSGSSVTYKISGSLLFTLMGLLLLL
ncbi:hypothetical protein PIROE2DRAFT_13756 [Piromyces sp. E2]|nr:hypothetical protein PIROE2DRAFT_13756 [Piromyces sp. E2]|eukprot:OUM60482.1 hypothetical protein PIROE2DRAFT_13756 [Piromyces sp. E2]